MIQVLVACSRDPIRHGTMTYALVIEGLSHAMADFEPPDAMITLGEWMRFGEFRTPILHEEIQTNTFESKGVGVVRRSSTPLKLQTPSLFNFSRSEQAIVIQRIEPSGESP